MKILVVALCVAYAAADVSHLVSNDDRNAEIVKQELDVDVAGTYQYGYETSNGIVANERGELKNVGGEVPAIAVQGQAEWTAPGGEKIDFQYTADENGYQPQGSWLPTSPPIPEAILRGLQYIRDHPPPPEKP